MVAEAPRGRAQTIRSGEASSPSLRKRSAHRRVGDLRTHRALTPGIRLTVLLWVRTPGFEEGRNWQAVSGETGTRVCLWLQESPAHRGTGASHRDVPDVEDPLGSELRSAVRPRCQPDVPGEALPPVSSVPAPLGVPRILLSKTPSLLSSQVPHASLTAPALSCIPGSVLPASAVPFLTLVP